MSLISIDIDQSSLSRSLQVINSVNCVVRELVENSIDANSTRIDVKLVNGGIDLIQVSDNGSGITESNFEMLATKHATSKITKFEDLFSSLNTFGFRGEALYSLCNLSTVEVETRIPTCDHGWLLNYDTLGRLTSKTPIASNIGTCVRVKELFKDYTVRQKILTKSIKTQISKAVSQLQQYALINPGIGFNLTTVSADNQYSNIFTTSGTHTTLRGVVEQIFGQDFSSKLVDVLLIDQNWKIEGLISSPYIETGYRDLEYFYINKRPIGKTYKFRYAILSVFSQFSSKSKPSFILNLTIDSDKVDVNLSPDKRSAFLFSEDYIIRTFKENLFQILLPRPGNMGDLKSELLSQYLSQHELEYTILPYLSSSNTQSFSSDRSKTPITDDQNSTDEYQQNSSKERSRRTPKDDNSTQSIPKDDNSTQSIPKDDNSTQSIKSENLQTPKMGPQDSSRYQGSEHSSRNQGSPDHPSRCQGSSYHSPKYQGSSEHSSKELVFHTPKEVNDNQIINNNTKSTFDSYEDNNFSYPVKRELVREDNESDKKLVIGLVYPNSYLETISKSDNSISSNKTINSNRTISSDKSMRSINSINSDKSINSNRTINSINSDRSIRSDKITISDTSIDSRDESNNNYEEKEYKVTRYDDEKEMDIDKENENKDKEEINKEIINKENKEEYNKRDEKIKEENKNKNKENKDTKEMEREYINIKEEDESSDSDSTPSNKGVLETNSVENVKPVPFVTLDEFLDTAYEEEDGYGECELLEIDEETLYSNEMPVMFNTSSEEECGDCELNKENLDEHNLNDPQVFQNMKLVGQFNNGFIITKLYAPDVKSNFNFSLYIIDQHAADEKAKFENLNKRVKVYKQNLINPKLIEISPFLTQVAEQHLDLLISNGFEITICKGSEEVMYKDSDMSMSRDTGETMIKGVYLHSFPQVLGKVLDEEDFVDFVNQLSYSEQTDGNYDEEFVWGGGSIPRPQKVWTILATKKNINSSCSPLEFAKNALLYGPYHPNDDQNNSFQGIETKDTQQSFRTEFKCSGVSVMDVVSVFNLGKSSFILCSDVKISLYKVYIYLSEALRRLKSSDQFENKDQNQEYSTYLATLNFLLNRFNNYIKISMNLSENVIVTPLSADTRSEVYNNSNVRKNKKFDDITSKFKVDQDEMRRIFRFDADDTKAADSSYYCSETMALRWSFYRDANCSDIFALLCYTLFTGNTFAYKSLLENFSPCMRSHVRSNWKVLLSYVPISFDFKEYQYTFESILFDYNNNGDFGFEVSVNEELLMSFTDWCLWRIFLIIKYTNSSYFLLIKFLKNLFKFLGSFESSYAIHAKLQVLNFLKFIIKQYFIYKSFNSTNVYKSHLTQSHDNYNKENADEMGSNYMSFFEYLDLDASKKLSLFCEFDVSGACEECSCSEQFKDKHKIYKSCLNCKTKNLCNKLKSFFVLISPGGDPTHSDDESTDPSHLQRYQEPNYKQPKSDMVYEGDYLDNEYLSVDIDFRNFYESLLRSYNSSLNDYISGISETFMKELNVHSFEILYSLSSVLLETGFKNKVFNIFVNTIFTNQCKYNFLENYFLIKSTFNLICANCNVNALGNNFDTSNTFFKLLRYFDTSKPKNHKSSGSYSSYRKLSNLLRNITKIYVVNTSSNDDDNNNENNNKEEEPELYHASQKYTPEVVVCSINCQLDFVESLLNLLSLMAVDTPTRLQVTPLELMMALVNEEYLLVLLQKVLLFVIDLSLVESEFSNCLMELVNLSSYLSNADPNVINSMFFYTITSRNNLNYLNEQLQLWFHSCRSQDHSTGSGGFGSGSVSSASNVGTSGNLSTFDQDKGENTNSNKENKNKNKQEENQDEDTLKVSTKRFLECSLDCVLNSVYRMDLSCDINLFQILVSYCKFVPENNKFYTTVSSSNSLSIYSVISLYLNYTNNFNKENDNDNKENNNTDNKDNNKKEKENEEEKKYSKYWSNTMNKLEMLVTISKVYKCMLIFDSYNLVNSKRHEVIEYKLYSNVHLFDLTLSTLISVIDSNYLSGGRLFSSRSFKGNRLYGSRVLQDLGKREKIFMLVFRCILEHVLRNKLYTHDFLNNLKIAIGELCPNEVSLVLFNIVDVLSNINDQSSLESTDYLKLDGPDEKLNGLLVNLLFILYYQSYNFLFMSHLLQFCVSNQLSKSLKFLYNHLMNTNPEVDSYDNKENKYKENKNNKENEKKENENKQDTNKENKENKNKEEDEERLEIEMGELFDYNNEDCDLNKLNNGYDDQDFRKDVLGLLDPSRSGKVRPWGSIGKLANKFGHNVASDFISAALEKAEGELLNIAKKTQKFDLLKDKLFYQKKEQSASKSIYAPVLNYFDSTPLFPVNFVDQENFYLNELLQYRNLKDITVSNMVSVNVELACQMLMENCCYTCNSVFLRDMQEVFNKNDLRKVYEFLDVLMKYLVYIKWSPGVLEKLEAVKAFLSQFLGFPENFPVLVTAFVYNRDYRLSLFKNIPSFLASNLQLVQDIYKNLGVFYDFDNYKDSVVVSLKPTENLEEYLFGPVLVEGNAFKEYKNKENQDRNKENNKKEEENKNKNQEDNTRNKENENKNNDVEDDSKNNLEKLHENNSGSLVEFDYMDEYVEVLFSVYEEIFLDDFNIESFLELEPLFLLNHEKYLYFLLKLYYSLTSNSNNTPTPSSIYSSFSISGNSSHSINTPRTTSSRSSGVNVGLNNSRLVMIRRCIYNFLQVYPDLKDSFSMLYKAESPDVIKLLETVLSNVPDFDLTTIDNFELFKQSLINYLNLNNFFFIAESFEKLDPSFSVAIYSKLELKLRPHSNELVDCTRMLFEYDLSNSTL